MAAGKTSDHNKRARDNCAMGVAGEAKGFARLVVHKSYQR